ncbi:hypothetical protein MVEG_04198 [Podila verticillata NRRL 6337]|nr:hypothetical protein MVEG_04198 [Podila verticillata NRRL 6337]
MFLQTHVDYADAHHTNHTHHLNLRMKNKALSKLFRRHDSETVFDEDDFQEYPSLTIDLVSKKATLSPRKRPVIQCLIRNTIREILKMATQSPVVFDTSVRNIERIHGITYPTEFNNEQREKIKQRFAAEAAKHERLAEAKEANVDGEDLEQINILLIGDVQSGKTSLVETFRLYADPAYTAKTKHITQGNSCFADEKFKITPFLTDLHRVEIRKLRQSTGGYDVVDLDEEAKRLSEEEAKRLSEEDFEDLLNLDPEGAETIIIASNGAKKRRFNIYEGPSLNESAENLTRTSSAFIGPSSNRIKNSTRFCLLSRLIPSPAPSEPPFEFAPTSSPTSARSSRSSTPRSIIPSSISAVFEQAKDFGHKASEQISYAAA